MKKKAKFVIEVEYNGDDNGNVISSESVDVLNFECEGDYKGLTLALTSGLGFAAKKGASKLDTFKDKLRLLRATASALCSIFGTLRRAGLVSDGKAGQKETEDILGEAVKRLVDYSCVGIANALGISKDQLDDVNQEYKGIHNENLKNKNNEQGEGQGDKPVDFDDYL